MSENKTPRQIVEESVGSTLIVEEYVLGTLTGVVEEADEVGFALRSSDHGRFLLWANLEGARHPIAS